MNLFLILISAICEAIWNVFLTKSKGFVDYKNNLFGLIFLLLSIYTFKKALNGFSLSTAIVIWSGLALVLTVFMDVYFFKTKINFPVAFFMSLCIFSILGLNYFSNLK